MNSFEQKIAMLSEYNEGATSALRAIQELAYSNDDAVERLNTLRPSGGDDINYVNGYRAILQMFIAGTTCKCEEIEAIEALANYIFADDSEFEAFHDDLLDFCAQEGLDERDDYDPDRWHRVSDIPRDIIEKYQARGRTIYLSAWECDQWVKSNVVRMFKEGQSHVHRR